MPRVRITGACGEWVSPTIGKPGFPGSEFLLLSSRTGGSGRPGALFYGARSLSMPLTLSTWWHPDAWVPVAGVPGLSHVTEAVTAAFSGIWMGVTQ